MAFIINIVPEPNKVSKEGKKYTLYHVQLDHGGWATTTNPNYKIGDRVRNFRDDTWDTSKIKPLDNNK